MKKFLIACAVSIIVLTGCGGDAHSAEKKLAVEYVNVMLQGDDAEAQKAFIEKNVLPEAQPLMSFAMNIHTDKSNAIREPEVADTMADEKSVVVLLRGKKADGSDTEHVVLFADGKVVMAVSGSDPNNKMFKDLRSKFDK